MVKTISARKSHKFKDKSELDFTKRDKFAEEWKSKWLDPNLHTRVHEAPISLEDVQESLSGLLSGKSPGLVKVTYDMLKYLPKSGLQALQFLFNKILLTGIFPKAFQEFAIVPVPRRGRTLN